MGHCVASHCGKTGSLFASDHREVGHRPADWSVIQFSHRSGHDPMTEGSNGNRHPKVRFRIGYRQRRRMAARAQQTKGPTVGVLNGASQSDSRPDDNALQEEVQE